VLRGIAERGALAPLFFDATTRPEFRPPWGMRSRHGTISLAPLDRGQVRSENITVRWRRSPAASAEAASGGGVTAGGISAGMIGAAAGCAAQFGARPKVCRGPATLRPSFQILIGQLAQDHEIDIVGAEHLGILGEPSMSKFGLLGSLVCGSLEKVE
jgi:hypothetical protein